MTNSNNNKKINLNLGKWYGSKVFEDTVKYQKQYGFEMGTGEHATWNNEADAFKHTYMQAQLALWGGKHISKLLGDYHEYQGNKYMGQSKGEENMDQWNNAQGREIAKEIILEYGIGSTIPFQGDKINNIIAEKVMQRMKAGKLITNPSDRRDYKKLKQSGSTGFAAQLEYDANHIFTPEEIGNLSPEKFNQYENQIMTQLQEGKINNQNDNNFSGYKNPFSGNAKIYSREDLDAMSTNEYSQNEKEIFAQMNSIGVPTNGELRGAGGTIYVESYTRRDGTVVKGYYRSV